MRRSRVPEWITFLLILAVGVALRLDLLIANNFVIDSDEAIVGLMAKHMREGGSYPVFYYGQHYMGSFEAIIASWLFGFFGISSETLKLTPFLFSIGLIVVTYMLGREFGGRAVASVSALLISCAPSALIIWSSMARGGFIEIVFIGALVLLVLTRWLKRERLSLLGVILLGLLIGFGWWVNNQIIYFIPPTGFFVLGAYLHDRKIRDQGRFQSIFFAFVSGVAAFFVGGLPFWLYNIEHHFVSFEMFKRAPVSDIFSHFGGVFTTALPILLGAKRFWGSEPIFPGATVVLYVILMGVILGYLLLRLVPFLRLLILDVDRKVPVEVLAVTSLTTLAIFSMSSFGYLVEAPRYLLPLYPALYVLVGFVVVQMFSALPLGSYALTGGLLLLSVISCYLGGRAIPGEPFVFNGERVAKNHDELLTWLQERKINHVRTNYWIGYRLAFETKEAVTFTIIQPPHTVRIKSYEAKLDKTPGDHVPMILTKTQGELVKKALDALCFNFQETTLSGYTVLFDIQPRESNLEIIPRKELLLKTNYHREDIYNATDGDIKTRWGSATPQVPGMEIRIDLVKPQSIRAVGLDLGEWAHDYPRSLTIELEDLAGRRFKVVEESAQRAVRYFLEDNPFAEFCFSAKKVRSVILRQEGRDEVFDWSIAELSLYH